MAFISIETFEYLKKMYKGVISETEDKSKRTSTFRYSSSALGYRIINLTRRTIVESIGVGNLTRANRCQLSRLPTIPS